MPQPHFLTSSPKNLGVKTAIRMIWQSKIMTLGVTCEIFALIGATWNWVDSYPWLPNVALTLATIGAVVVAGRVAWDYHGRGLNAKQKEESKDILTNASLNETQMDEIAEAIQSSGLTPGQKSDLPATLGEISVANIVEVQKALDVALEYLLTAQRPDHGHVVVIHRIGRSQLDVRYVDPPRASGPCQRQHAHEQGADLNLLEVANSLLQPLTKFTVLWRHPVDQKCFHTNYNAAEDPGHFLTFSFEDCVPKWRIPIVDDYVLSSQATGDFTWGQTLSLPIQQP